MDPELRSRFNADFTSGKYEALVRCVNESEKWPADFRISRNQFKEIRPHLLGVRARETYAFDTFDRRNAIEEMYERQTGIQIPAIRVDRLSEKYDLSRASMHGDPHLSLDFVGSP